MALEPICGLEAPPPWLPRFEDEWLPGQGIPVPVEWTDNAWRAAQTATRALFGLPALPAWPTPTVGDIFCSPSALQSGVTETGDGSEGNPFILISSARTAANAAGERVWIETGKVIQDTGALLDGTSNFLSLAALNAGTEWRCWFRTANRYPTIIRRAQKFGPNPANWDAVDMKTGQAAGTPITAVGGVYTLDTSGTGMRNWHFNVAPFGTLAPTIAMVGYESPDSILNVVNIQSEAAYKAHGWDARHVKRNAMGEGSGGDAGKAVIPSPNYAPLDQDMQWAQTTSGGLVVRSDENPATRWGGVYVLFQFHVGLAITGSDVLVDHAFQFEHCGTAARFQVNAAGTMSGSVLYGLHARNCGSPYYVASATNDSPITGVHGGRVHMGAGNNYQAAPAGFGDGTQPWLENCRIERIRGFAFSSGPSRQGWLRGWKEYDIRLHACRLQGGGTGCDFVTSIATFAYTDYNEQMYFYESLMDSGVGTFGDTDGGQDNDGGAALFRRHHGRVYVAVRGSQSNGAGRALDVHMVEYIDVVNGMELTDSVWDGTAEIQYDHMRVVLSRKSDWAIVASFPSTFTKQWGVKIGRSVNFQPKGPLTSARTAEGEVRSHNIGPARLRNCEVDIGTALPGDACAVVNDTIIAGVHGTALNGIWVDTTPGGPNHRAATVPPLEVPSGQTQVSQLWVAPINGLLLIGFDPLKEFVNKNFDNDALQRAGTSRLVSLPAPVRDADGALLPSAPPEVRSGNIFLDAGNEGPDTLWMQPGASRFDLARVTASSAADTSIGPLHYRAITGGRWRHTSPLCVGGRPQVANAVSFLLRKMTHSTTTTPPPPTEGPEADFLARTGTIIASRGHKTNFTANADVADFFHSGNCAQVDAPYSLSGAKAMRMSCPQGQSTLGNNWCRFLRDNMEPFGSVQDGMDEEFWYEFGIYIPWDHYNWVFKSNNPPGVFDPNASKKFFIISQPHLNSKNPITRVVNANNGTKLDSSSLNEIVLDDKGQRGYVEVYRRNAGGNNPITDVIDNNACSTTDFLHMGAVDDGVKTGTPTAGAFDTGRTQSCRDYVAQFGPDYRYGQLYGGVQNTYRDAMTIPHPDPIAGGPKLEPGLNHIRVHWRYPTTWAGTTGQVLEVWIWHPGDTGWRQVHDISGISMSAPETTNEGVPWNGGRCMWTAHCVWLTTFLTNGVGEPGVRLDTFVDITESICHTSGIAPPTGVAYDGAV